MLGVLDNDPSELPPADLDRMVDGMATINNQVEVLLKKNQSYTKVCSRFPLELFLKKITSVSNAAETLLRYAYSPRLYRRYLGRMKFDVQPLRNAPGWISIPPSDGWLNVSKEILAQYKKESLLEWN
ncbi:hypothetical protein AJ80_07398 [Polytolypa hystricis UAMH7299]|uniref:Uncharacterized protein n=1 Tax=Polytolypa hystricis (strain UAMH7299) TaxID=1447883 RepID=A0A2B7XQ66_POLH7|nr:hypothetical protein AJ80_07398 [Polytolypa hystricis UAMH7299]